MLSGWDISLGASTWSYFVSFDAILYYYMLFYVFISPSSWARPCMPALLSEQPGALSGWAPWQAREGRSSPGCHHEGPIRSLDPISSSCDLCASPLYIWLCWTFPLFQKCPHGAQAKREEGTFVWVFFWKPLSWWTRNLLHHSPTCKQIRYLHHLPLMMELASDGPMSCWERVTVCKCFIGHHQPSLLEIKYKWSQMLRA